MITGFNGATADGRPTTLGRGGSDFSASILAAALDAAELWIWTDVDGIMSADPRLVPDAQVLDEITYAEAAELAYNGAKVLHPRTLAPLVEKEIPVWSKNSFAPEKPGTKIVPAMAVPHGRARGDLDAQRGAGVARAGQRRTERGAGAWRGRWTRSRARTWKCWSSPVPATGRTSASWCARRSWTAPCRRWNRRWRWNWRTATCIRFEVDRNVGLLAAVGEGMQGKPGLAGRIFTAISRVQVNIIAIAQGSSELTIAVVVRRDGLEKAVKAVHAECGLGMRPPVPVFPFRQSEGPAPRSGKRRGRTGRAGLCERNSFRYTSISPLEHRSSV